MRNLKKNPDEEKLKLWQNYKKKPNTHIMIKPKTQIRKNLKTQIVTSLKNWDSVIKQKKNIFKKYKEKYSHKTQKLKLWHNSNDNKSKKNQKQQN